MSIVADAHVHIYPFYDLAAVLGHLAANLGAHAGEVATVALLAERSDCHAFRDMSAYEAQLAEEGWSVSAASDDLAWILLREGGLSLYVVAGRQVVTAERLEVLALTADADLPDGLSAAEAVGRVADEGAVPVLAWAPGKWFGGRGRVVRQLIDAAVPGGLLIGDTSLRPTCWAEPLLMRRARRRGLRILCGSDPLPFAGEERVAGTYASVLGAEFDPARPVASIRRALHDPDLRVRHAGHRCGPCEVLRRLRQNAAAKGAGGNIQCPTRNVQSPSGRET